jgi:UDPglucose--hexose-1-phosphate uridylyltransferase
MAGNGTVLRSRITLADGRELFYFGESAQWAAGYPDQRPPGRVHASSGLRYDPLLGEWVIVASHRQDRTYLPPADHCPFDPSAPGRLTEIPAPRYEVAVFENRFPALVASGGDARSAALAAEVPGPGGGAGDAAPAAEATGPGGGAGDAALAGEATGPGGRASAAAGGLGGEGAGPVGLLAARPGNGRCEVVCFSQDHSASFADLTPGQVAVVLAAWTDRSAALAVLPGVEQVYCFENRGQEIGVTLTHPHGQIYAYPFVTPRTSRMLTMASRYRRQAGGNLFDDVVAAELSDRSRIVIEAEHWVAFVPHAAHWPYEAHLYPRRRVPDLPGLGAAEREEFCGVYLDLLRRFDRLFGIPAPYISAWHQAPVRAGREEFALHLELFTIRRGPDKLKFLAGSESGMGAFTSDIAPEAAAAALRGKGAP